MLSRQHHSLLLSIFLNLLFLTSSATAELVCVSPPTSTTSLRSGTPFSLRFTNKPTTLGSALLSDVSANLICTSTGDSVLTLAKKLEQGKSVLATISPAQAASALKLCPANNFHVQYEESSFLSKNSENCAGSFSIQLAPPLAAVPDTAKQPEHPAIALPPISVPLPIPGVPTTATTTTGSASAEPTVTTIVEPQPTITAPIKPTTTTTIIATTTSTTAAVVPPVVPPNPTSATTTAPLKNPPPAATTTHPPKSGGNHNGGGGNGSGGNDLESSPTNSSGDISSSDMQQSTGSGPSTASIAGMSIGVVAGIFVILGAMLVWRRRSQRRADFDLFYTDTLAAASGFQQPKNSGLGPRGTGGLGSTTTTTPSAEQPIYGRPAPEQDDKYEISGNMNNSNINNNNSAAHPVTRKPSSNTPRRSRSHTSTHHQHRHPTNNSNRSPIPPSAPPPPLMPMHPYPIAGNGGQDSSFYQPDSYYNNQYHQHQQPDYYQQQQQQHLPQRKPSYKLPRQHPAFDYDDRSYRSQ